SESRTTSGLPSITPSTDPRTRSATAVRSSPTLEYARSGAPPWLARSSKVGTRPSSALAHAPGERGHICSGPTPCCADRPTPNHGHHAGKVPRDTTPAFLPPLPIRVTRLWTTGGDMSGRTTFVLPGDQGRDRDGRQVRRGRSPAADRS